MKASGSTAAILPVANGDGGRLHAMAEAPPAVCYRMEPSKRMLAREGCAGACGAPDSARDCDMPPCLLARQQHTVVSLAGISRAALMITPRADGDVRDQVWEAVSTIRAILRQQATPMAVTQQTVFLRRAEDAEVCRTLFRAYFGERMPATTFIEQPPCGGEALAIEAWAIGGPRADVRYLAPDVVEVAYDGLRWIHVGGVVPAPVPVDGAYAQTRRTFDDLAGRLAAAGARMRDVVRTWIYVGSITEPDVEREAEIERYREMNRARTDFFDAEEAAGRMDVRRDGGVFFPASTGIGMTGRSLAVGCLALQTERADVRLLPLENPRQISAFDYARRFSAKSPKFSRAMAVRLGDYVTTWVSGTASIVDAETVHLGDARRQTEETIDNIAALISPENFARHGLPGAGAELSDLAKVRVYVKRPEDYAACRAVCERRFGALPAVYALADVCRSNLLVEIEGVAFSRMNPPPASDGA